MTKRIGNSKENRLRMVAAVLKLVDIEKMSIDETAKKLNISARTVYEHLRYSENTSVLSEPEIIGIIKNSYKS